MMLPPYRRMVEAMMGKDADFDGRFYVGVHSTGIYCLPSCKARKPLLKNVVFYHTREEAIAAGLRSCRRCAAERYPDYLPTWLHKVLHYMREHKQDRLNEIALIRLSGVDISTIRRYFKQHLGETPLSFHRRIRLNSAREMIEKGQDYLSACYDCGYESASGFREAFTKQFGKPPGAFYDRN